MLSHYFQFGGGIEFNRGLYNQHCILHNINIYFLKAILTIESSIQENTQKEAIQELKIPDMNWR